MHCNFSFLFLHCQHSLCRKAQLGISTYTQSPPCRGSSFFFSPLSVRKLVCHMARLWFIACAIVNKVPWIFHNLSLFCIKYLSCRHRACIFIIISCQMGYFKARLWLILILLKFSQVSINSPVVSSVFWLTSQLKCRQLRHRPGLS